jgi:outer membrane protein OmpA-like peptidoglycan-associated protein
MKLKAFALSMCAALLLSSCGTWKNTGWGTAIGTVAGSAVGLGIGYWIDHNSDSNTGKIVGTSVGAAVGATTGALIGHKMDKAAAAAKEVEGAQVELVDVNGLPAVKVTFESGILFGFNSSSLSDEAKVALTDFAEVLKTTPDADVAILGHTDNVGSDKANQSVSEKRAKAVANFLVEQGAVATQIKDVLGMSHTQPIASNDTEEGKAQNRRVEVYMYASQAMINAANAEAAN